MKRYIKKISKELIIYIVVAFVSYLIYALIPHYTKILFEGEYKKSVIGYTISLLSFIALAYIGNLIQKRWQIKFVKILKKDYFNKVITLNYEEFSKRRVGEYISFQGNDIELIKNDYLNPLVGIVIQVLRIITNFVIIAMTLNIKISIILISISILGVMLPKSLGRETAKRRDIYLNNQKKYYSTIEELFNGFKIINNRTRNNIKINHDKSLNSIADKEYHYGKANGLMWALNGLGSESLNYITFLYLGYLRYKGNIDSGFAIAAFQYAQSLTEPVHEILYGMGLVNSTKKMRYSFLEFVGNNNKTENRKKISSVEEIQINNLNKSYENFSLKNINLNLKKHKKYALIGLNGSGKSTLLDILSSHIKDYSGELKIDKNNINDIDHSYLIGIMNQNEYVFSESFQNNVTVFDSYKNIDDNIFLEDAMEFKDTYNSKKLSGGQKKIIGLCRLVNASTPVILLDEPLSAIDGSGKEYLLNKIISLNKIVVMITHDLDENLSKFDRVLFMEDGKLIYNLPYKDIKNKKEFLVLQNIIG